MQIKKLQPGQVVYEARRTQMGNTTMKTVSVYRIYVREIDPEFQWVLASWNGNPVQKYYTRAVSKWKKDKPVTISTGLRTRLATREEIKAMKERGEIK